MNHKNWRQEFDVAVAHISEEFEEEELESLEYKITNLKSWIAMEQKQLDILIAKRDIIKDKRILLKKQK